MNTVPVPGGSGHRGQGGHGMPLPGPPDQVSMPGRVHGCHSMGQATGHLIARTLTDAGISGSGSSVADLTGPEISDMLEA